MPFSSSTFSGSFPLSLSLNLKLSEFACSQNYIKVYPDICKRIDLLCFACLALSISQKNTLTTEPTNIMSLLYSFYTIMCNKTFYSFQIEFSNCERVRILEREKTLHRASFTHLISCML